MTSALLFLIFSAFLLSKHFTRAKDININVKECTKNDFLHDYDSCTLKCALDLSDTNFKVDGYKFYYYSTDPAVNVDLKYVGDRNISVGFKYQNNQVELDATLSASKYNAGYYVCWVKLIDIAEGNQTQISYHFQIDSSNAGTALGSKCSSAHECWALDAQCNANCECGSGYTNYNGKIDTPACLPASHYYCIVDEQCQVDWNDKGYKCRQNKCKFITDDDDDDDDYLGLSTGAIIGISVSLGSVFFAAIAVGITLYRKKQSKKFWEGQKAEITAAIMTVD